MVNSAEPVRPVMQSYVQAKTLAGAAEATIAVAASGGMLLPGLVIDGPALAAGNGSCHQAKNIQMIILTIDD